MRRGARPIDPAPAGRTVSLPVLGHDLEGAPASIAPGRRHLLVFVSPDCDGCRDLVALVERGQVLGVDVTGVLRRPAGGLPDPELAAFGARGGRWFVDEAAHGALQVRKGPYWCLLDERGAVLAEGLPLGEGDAEAGCRAALLAEGS